MAIIAWQEEERAEDAQVRDSAAGFSPWNMAPTIGKCSAVNSFECAVSGVLLIIHPRWSPRPAQGHNQISSTVCFLRRSGSYKAEW